MNDLDTRARAAASGLRTAVDQFDFVELQERRPPARRRSSLSFGLIAFVVVVALLGLLLAVARDDRPPASPDIRRTEVGGYPVQITVDARGAFVANQEREVIRLNRRTGAIVARVPTGRAVYDVVTDPKLGIWAFGGGDGADTSGDLVFLGPSTSRPPTTIHLDDGVKSLALTAGRVWTVDTAGDLTARDPRTLEVTYGRNVAPSDTSAALTAVKGTLWVATGPVLRGLDPKHPGTTLPVTVGLRGTEEFAAVATDGRWLWATVCIDSATQRCFLERRDPRTGALRERFTDYPLARNDGGPRNLIGAEGAAWVIGAAGPSLLTTTPSGGVERVLTIPRRLRSTDSFSEYRYFGVGAGALWYSVPERGLVYRIPLPDRG